uniref:Uncharacterized protein n=1 Tax=Alexandrium catenella TaxID=2925 RepID=A0A7S1LNZ4_ALECA|mmetsp:Transcript_117484/g.312516  ORF Transcript_117484/g.312516 Transcript_117484/m.312516 type:complete len:348 (+) Transcript_117484:70-1113(+)|eukprot:CAMPEP_0171177098 /NCGR_PEP_ID=MMETSP0790-20130122/12068_1 /TAXON_ID=2925 /ORGANISM="Alexandrium catenella, Strain OF101" /LENGTH=347 /DNA_ID=CAMNT_0011641993 /DNA_START=51 /DNA_END=1094 /DNA_ORIENTATION=-
MSLGATLPEFVSSCWDLQPSKLKVALGGGGVCFLLTIAVVLVHRRELLAEPISMRRAYYMRIAYTPVVFAATAYLALWSPSSILLSATLQKFYEALTLSTFGMLLFLLLWAESQAALAPGSEESKAEVVVRALAMQGPRSHWSAPPLGCCFRPCLPEHDLSVRSLSTMFLLVRQFVLLTPAVGILGMVFLTAFQLDWLARALWYMKMALLTSSLLCLYGLFVTYWSTHDLLHRWNTTSKFVAIKVVLVVMAYQEFLLEHVGPRILKDRNSCFKSAGFHVLEWEAVECRYWSMFLLTIEMMFMALALRRAFPAKELRQPIQEVHHAFLDMELTRAKQDEGLEEALIKA